ncbi:hypothetical protein ADU20_02305 [Burkholderia pseudomallei]|nr:hypothetical protein ADU20_02305 [Burkholderia pseudomallei]
MRRRRRAGRRFAASALKAVEVAAAVGLVKARPMRADAGQCGPMRDRRARLPSLATREAPAVRAGGFESRRDAGSHGDRAVAAGSRLAARAGARPVGRRRAGPAC